MEWYTKPFKVVDKLVKQNGLYTNHYLIYETEYEKDGEKKKTSSSIQVPLKIFEMIPKGSKVQLKRVEFYHKKDKKYYDFISEANIAK